MLAKVVPDEADRHDLAEIEPHRHRRRPGPVPLAGQAAGRAVVERVRGDVERRLADIEALEPVARAEPAPIADLIDLTDGAAVWDERHAGKQPGWSFDAAAPVARRPPHALTFWAAYGDRS